MNRRQFLASSTSLAVGVWNAQSVVADNKYTSQPSFDIPAQQAFKSSFEGVPSVYGPTSVTFNKTLPEGLRGTLYRNGPARMKLGSTQNQHWFDGDGMVHSFTLRDNQLVHQARMVQTEKYQEDNQAGRFLRNGFGTVFKDSLPLTQPDNINVANISVLPVQGELLALWEAGSAWRIDPATLKTLGRKTFSESTDRASFSAHPRIDSDGRIWNFGYLSGADKLLIYDIAASGKLNRAKVIQAPQTNMIHDFVVTEHYLVFLLMPITFDAKVSDASHSFIDRLGWDDTGKVDVLVVSKSDLEVTHRFELDPFFAFHFGNAWEENHELHVEIAIAQPLFELNRAISLASKGESPVVTSVENTRAPVSQEITLNLKNHQVGWRELPFHNADFPSYDNRYTGTPTNRLFMLTRSPSMPEKVFGFNAVAGFNRKINRFVQWNYHDGCIAEEHVFVPKPAAPEGVGWLLGTVYDWQRKVTFLSVLDSQSLESGPVATATLPYHLPLGLHGKYVES